MEGMRQCIAVWKPSPKSTCHVRAHTHAHTAEKENDSSTH